jgi:hypothetical protein
MNEINKLFAWSPDMLKYKKTLNENQIKFLTDELEEKLENLLECKENRITQMGILGTSLNNLIEEIKKINGILDILKGKNEE